ncbi:MAG TPA: UDP-3-O-(3-hydroxymyristoyl)glucosamine N-acyltransferase [Polyangiaceae bacterium]|nr:UDP-3-O-(3-hydroxymyristoyl)glucosamine N-acyltransferase [Polyangiaceae bacterium]
MTPPRDPHGIGVSFPCARSLAQLACDFGGDTTQPHVLVDNVAAPKYANHRSLVPIFRASALKNLRDAAAVLVSPELVDKAHGYAPWRHPFAQFALAHLLTTLAPQRHPPTRSPHAIIENGVALGKDVTIGHGAVILAGAVLGDACIIEPRAVIYGSVRLGQRVLIGAGAVIGRPGFGWASGPDRQRIRMPQLGGVEIEDDVEVGPLATVDAGTLKPTRLRKGCKLDAHVHVGHNVEVGQYTLVAAQSGFAGSATIGNHVLIGGQVGVADHVTLGDCTKIAGKSGVIGPIPAQSVVAGYPAVSRLRWLRAVATLMRGRS